MPIFIGISANVSEKEFLPGSFMKQYSLNSSYVDAVIRAGGIPIILPIANEENIKEYGSIFYNRWTYFSWWKGCKSKIL